MLYRLNALTLKIPPLVERLDDLDALATHFLAVASENNQRRLADFEPAALAALRAHRWPGNVRELRNAIERAVVIADGDRVTLADLPAAVRRAGGHGEIGQPVSSDGPRDGEAGSSAASPRRRCEGEDFRACMERLETEVLLEALAQVEDNQTEAARLLKMPRRTLVRKIKVLGLKRLGYAAEDGEDDDDSGE